VRNRTPPTDATSERERRLASALDEAMSSLNSAVERLNGALAIASLGPQTCPELIWRLQAVTTIQQIQSQRASIALLSHLREDVADVQS